MAHRSTWCDAAAYRLAEGHTDTIDPTRTWNTQEPTAIDYSNLFLSGDFWPIMSRVAPSHVGEVIE